MYRRFGLMLLAAALCLMLAGCGQNSQPSSQEPPRPERPDCSLRLW